jgi:hypothetical protein
LESAVLPFAGITDEKENWITLQTNVSGITGQF